MLSQRNVGLKKKKKHTNNHDFDRFSDSYFTQPKLVVYSFFRECSILLRGEQGRKECACEGSSIFSLAFKWQNRRCRVLLPVLCMVNERSHWFQWE